MAEHSDHNQDQQDANEESESKAIEELSRPRVLPPEGLYELEIKTGRAGLKFEKRLGCQYRGPGVENYADRYQKDTGKTKRNKLKLILEEVPDEWKMREEFDKNCAKARGVYLRNSSTSCACEII